MALLMERTHSALWRKAGTIPLSARTANPEGSQAGDRKPFRRRVTRPTDLRIFAASTTNETLLAFHIGITAWLNAIGASPEDDAPLVSPNRQNQAVTLASSDA
jgi:hypothetical protein